METQNYFMLVIIFLANLSRTYCCHNIRKQDTLNGLSVLGIIGSLASIRKRVTLSKSSCTIAWLPLAHSLLNCQTTFASSNLTKPCYARIWWHSSLSPARKVGSRFKRCIDNGKQLKTRCMNSILLPGNYLDLHPVMQIFIHTWIPSISISRPYISAARALATAPVSRKLWAETNCKTILS